MLFTQPLRLVLRAFGGQLQVFGVQLKSTVVIAQALSANFGEITRECSLKSLPLAAIARVLLRFGRAVKVAHAQAGPLEGFNGPICGKQGMFRGLGPDTKKYAEKRKKWWQP